MKNEFYLKSILLTMDFEDDYGNFWRDLGCGCVKCLEVSTPLYIPDTGKYLEAEMILTIDQLQTAINYAEMIEDY